MNKHRIIDILGFVAIVVSLFVYKYVERAHGDYWAVGIAIVLAMLIGATLLVLHGKHEPETD